MIKLLFIIIGITSVFGNVRSFFPSTPDGTIYNPNRIWAHLSQKCFPQETDALQFKDYLLSNYQCISFNQRRSALYQFQVTGNYNVWSLWLEKANGFADFDCLNKAITLPQNILPSCIDYVYYESVSMTMQTNTWGCTNQEAADPLWSLDILDGKHYDNNYNYPYWGDLDIVHVIVLDTDIYTGHTEFSEASPEPLKIGVSGLSFDHGTHVAATIVGKNVGGAKKIKLLYYPVCDREQGVKGCSDSYIEDGYRAAIDHMRANPNKRYVINFSVGGLLPSQQKRDWYDSFGRDIADAKGIWVVAAGNEDIDACVVAPAFSQYALTVGAYDKDKKRASFSNWGQCVNVYGPGVNIYSAAPSDNGYQLMSGTSMASPNVASMVVNYKKWYPDATLDAIQYYMRQYARCEYDPTTIRHGLPIIGYDQWGRPIFTRYRYQTGVGMVQPYLPFCTGYQGSCH